MSEHIFSLQNEEDVNQLSSWAGEEGKKRGQKFMKFSEGKNLIALLSLDFGVAWMHYIKTGIDAKTKVELGEWIPCTAPTRQVDGYDPGKCHVCALKRDLYTQARSTSNAVFADLIKQRAKGLHTQKNYVLIIKRGRPVLIMDGKGKTKDQCIFTQELTAEDKKNEITEEKPFPEQLVRLTTPHYLALAQIIQDSKYPHITKGDDLLKYVLDLHKYPKSEQLIFGKIIPEATSIIIDANHLQINREEVERLKKEIDSYFALRPIEDIDSALELNGQLFGGSRNKSVSRPSANPNAEHDFSAEQKPGASNPESTKPVSASTSPMTYTNLAEDWENNQNEEEEIPF